MPPTTTVIGCSSSCWRWASGETRALTRDDHVYADPTFSPDGARVAYVSTRPSGYFNIAVRPVDEGRWAGDEMPITTDHAYPANRLYFGPWDMHMTPAWLPAAPESTESDELLLVSNRDIPLGSGNVLRVPVAPGGIRNAVTVLREQTLYRTRPDVASDGRRFVYSSTRGGGRPVQQPVRAADGGGRALQADVLSSTMPSIRAGRPTTSGSRSSPTRTDCRSSHCWRRTEARCGRWRSPNDGGGAPWACCRSAPAPPTPEPSPARGSTSPRRTGSSMPRPMPIARLSARGDHVFHTTGAFTVEAPAGPLELTVVKGFEFHPGHRQPPRSRPARRPS